MRRNRVELTERELEVLRLVAAGCRYSEIGQILYIEKCTVQNHMSKIMLKLDAINSHHATTIAQRLHIITIADIPTLESLSLFQ